MTHSSHDRHPDGMPAGTGYTDSGAVLGRDVARRVRVGVEGEPARSADEQRAASSVIPRRECTAGARLRGQSRINRDHRTTASLGLVRDELANLGERPAVYPARARSCGRLDPRADVGQVLDDDRPSGWRDRDDLLGEHVIAIAAKQSLAMTHPAQSALGAPGSLRLQRPPVFEVAPFDRAPRLLTQESVGAGDGWLRQSEINADNSVGRGDLGGRNGHDGMQPPGSAAIHQVGRVMRSTHVLRGVGGNRKRHFLPTACGREARRLLCPVQAVGILVVPRRAGQRARLIVSQTALLQRERATDRLGGFHSRLDDKVGHKRRVRVLDFVVRHVMQRRRVANPGLPSNRGRLVERAGELPGCFRHHRGLLARRVQTQADRSLHRFILPYFQEI